MCFQAEEYTQLVVWGSESDGWCSCLGKDSELKLLFWKSPTCVYQTGVMADSNFLCDRFKSLTGLISCQGLLSDGLRQLLPSHRSVRPPPSWGRRGPSLPEKAPDRNRPREQREPLYHLDFIDYGTHVCVQMTIKFTQLFKHICQGQLQQHLSPARPAEAARRHVWRCARITVGVVRRVFFFHRLCSWIRSL